MYQRRFVKAGGINLSQVVEATGTKRIPRDILHDLPLYNSRMPQAPGDAEFDHTRGRG